MIIRVLGYGQYRVDDAAMAAINALDDKVQATVEQLSAQFRAQIAELAAAIDAAGTPVPVDEIIPSDAVVPGPDTALGDALNLLTDEGLIPN